MFSKKYAVSLSVLILVSFIFLSAFSQSRAKIRAESEAERNSYLLSLGYEECYDPAEVREINIPTRFDDSFKKLNAVIKESGFDLSDYKGKTVKLYTYLFDKHKQLNIFVYKGYLVGTYITDLEDGEIYPL